MPHCGAWIKAAIKHKPHFPIRKANWKSPHTIPTLFPSDFPSVHRGRRVRPLCGYSRIRNAVFCFLVQWIVLSQLTCLIWWLDGRYLSQITRVHWPHCANSVCGNCTNHGNDGHQCFRLCVSHRPSAICQLKFINIYISNQHHLYKFKC